MGVSFMSFFLSARELETRLSLVTGLFLALVAVQVRVVVGGGRGILYVVHFCIVWQGPGPGRGQGVECAQGHRGRPSLTDPTLSLPHKKTKKPNF